jgi:hypothetical protein
MSEIPNKKWKKKKKKKTSQRIKESRSIWSGLTSWELFPYKPHPHPTPTPTPSCTRDQRDKVIKTILSRQRRKLNFFCINEP